MRVHFQICSQCNMYAVRYPFSRQVRDQFVRDCQAVASKGGSAADLEAARNPIPVRLHPPRLSLLFLLLSSGSAV
jgi:hypothetical protein